MIHDFAIKIMTWAQYCVRPKWQVSPMSRCFNALRHLVQKVDRHGLRSTIITSQVPVDSWHSLMANPTVADAILDRLVHNAYRINLTGESMRKVQAKIGESDDE